MLSLQRKLPLFAKYACLSFFTLMLAACGRSEVDAERGEMQAPGDHADQVAVLDPYTLRASAVRSNFLPEEVAQQYRIQPSADVGVLTLTILERKSDGQETTVAADVNVHQDIPLGQSTAIAMQELTVDGYTSYIGTFDAAHENEFFFIVSAIPEGSDTTLTIEVQEDFGADE